MLSHSSCVFSRSSVKAIYLPVRIYTACWASLPAFSPGRQWRPYIYLYVFIQHVESLFLRFLQVVSEGHIFTCTYLYSMLSLSSCVFSRSSVKAIYLPVRIYTACWVSLPAFSPGRRWKPYIYLYVFIQHVEPLFLRFPPGRQWRPYIYLYVFIQHVESLFLRFLQVVGESHIFTCTYLYSMLSLSSCVFSRSSVKAIYLPVRIYTACWASLPAFSPGRRWKPYIYLYVFIQHVESLFLRFLQVVSEGHIFTCTYLYSMLSLSSCVFSRSSVKAIYLPVRIYKAYWVSLPAFSPGRRWRPCFWLRHSAPPFSFWQLHRWNPRPNHLHHYPSHSGCQPKTVKVFQK